MSEIGSRSPAGDPLQPSLRRVRLCVLALLAVCAAVIATQSGGDPQDLAPRVDRLLLTALGLALASIFARQLATAPKAGLRARVWLALTSYLLAGGIGLVGVTAVQLGSDRARGLLYVCAGAIFALRPTSPHRSRPRA